MKSEEYIRQRLAAHLKELMLLEKEGYGGFFRATIEAKAAELELILDD